MKFKSNNKKIFFEPSLVESISLEKGEKVDIILSPSLYWVKEISLPVKSVRDVKKLLPSIFEEFLPEGNYSYSAYKHNDIFIIFAYEDKKILELLSSNGIASSQIASIRFAQSEFQDIETPLKVAKDKVLYLKENILLLAPLSWFSSFNELSLETLKFSKHKINLQQYSHIVDPKTLYKIGAVLFVFVILLIVELLVSNTKLNNLTVEKDALYSKYKLQATTFQNKASYKKYSKIHETQIKLRESIALFLKLRLQNTQKIESIIYKNRVLVVIISGIEKGNDKKITNQLSKKKLHFESSIHSGRLKVEVKL